MAEIARRTTTRNNRVMFVIHRKEVLEQAENTFKQQGVNMDLATMGMVQTLTRRVDKIPEPQLILIDEAHHVLAKSYQRILNKFPNAYVLLFTATPIRAGKKQLDLVADDIIIGQSIKELTKNGFLAPFKYYSVPYDDLDTKKLKKSSTGDYTQNSMDDAMNNKIYGHVVETYLRLAKDKQAVVYTYSVESAKRLAKQFQDQKVDAKELDGATNQRIRDETVKAFRDKQLQILVNVDLFTEGVDLPDVDCVIMVRPTESLALYMQFSMRCLNPRKGKTAIIIDHVKNYQKFGLPDSNRDWKKAVVTKKKRKRKSKDVDAPAIVTCPNCFGVLERKAVTDNTCYLCGFTPLVQIQHKKVVDAEIKEIKEVDIEKRKKVEQRQELMQKIIHSNVLQNVAGKSLRDLRTYEEFKAYAEIHGYSNGYAWTMFNKMIRKRKY